MEVTNCRKCKRLFNYISGQRICPACREELESKFQEVKKYLFDNRNATIAQVVENCDVDEHQIRQWIREERLEFSSGIDASIVCENCGTLIKSGRYCDKCKASMVNDLNSVGRKTIEPAAPQVKKTTHENKMRFLNR